MHITPGPTRYAVRNVDTAESAFQLFFTPSLLQQIIDWTNKEGRLVYGHQWADVDNIQMHCYLGLLTLAGVMKSHNKSVMSLWNKENGRAIFNRSMARNRFTVISRCIQFDDAAARRRTRSTDKLASIQDVFKLCVKFFRIATSQTTMLQSMSSSLPFAADARFVSLFLHNLASMKSKSGLCVIA